MYAEIAGGPRAAGPQLFRLLDEDGALEGPFNAMLFAPRVGLHLQRLGSALRYETTLPAGARELAILLCARRERSEFEWYAHAPIALAAGVPERVVEQVLSGGEPECEDPVELATVAFTAAMLDGDVDDDAYAAAKEVLTDRQLVELVTLVGYYRLLSGALRVFRVPLPAGVSPVFGDETGAGSPMA